MIVKFPQRKYSFRKLIKNSAFEIQSILNIKSEEEKETPGFGRIQGESNGRG